MTTREEALVYLLFFFRGEGQKDILVEINPAVLGKVGIGINRRDIDSLGSLASCLETRRGLELFRVHDQVYVVIWGIGKSSTDTRRLIRDQTRGTMALERWIFPKKGRITYNL